MCKYNSNSLNLTANQLPEIECQKMAGLGDNTLVAIHVENNPFPVALGHWQGGAQVFYLVSDLKNESYYNM